MTSGFSFLSKTQKWCFAFAWLASKCFCFRAWNAINVEHVEDC